MPLTNPPTIGSFFKRLFPSQDNLYVALYARAGDVTMPGEEDRYHWALLIGPKTEDTHSLGKQFHAKQRQKMVDGQLQYPWEVNECDVDMGPTSMILARIRIGKIKDKDRLEAILRSVPTRGETPGWNCVCWVKEVLETLQFQQSFHRRIFQACKLD